MFKVLRTILMDTFVNGMLKTVQVPIGHHTGPGKKSIMSARHDRACANRRVFTHPAKGSRR